MSWSVMIALALTATPFASAAFQPPAAAPPVRATLTEAQKRMLSAAETDLRNKIAPFADQVSQTAKELNRALLADKADAEAQRRLADDLAKRVSELAAEAIRIRVSAVREIVESLSPQQKSLLLVEVDKPGADADLVNVIRKVFEEKSK